MENLLPISLPFLFLLIAVIVLLAIKMIEAIIQIITRIFQYFLLLCVFLLIAYYVFLGRHDSGHPQKTSIVDPNIQVPVPGDSLPQIHTDSFPLPHRADRRRRQQAGSTPLPQDDY
jgi:hypothetical protein